MGLRQLRRTEGSSPRVRGTPASTLAAFLATGIIPACAGNTPEARKFRDIPGDHPRVCGEHFGGLKDKVLGVGSSPRVRGTRTRLLHGADLRGIIPACAGNTFRLCSSSSSAWDHPRVCGEHEPGSYTARIFEGSSPRVRGTPDAVCRELRGGGIIPACAGNTFRPRSLFDNAWDHPRVCGEHQGYAIRPICRSGSSPRVRGTPGVRHTPHMPFGIIPACAGNTSRRRRMTTSSRGSSPRVRGTPAC